MKTVSGKFGAFCLFFNLGFGLIVVANEGSLEHEIDSAASTITEKMVAQNLESLRVDSFVSVNESANSGPGIRQLFLGKFSKLNDARAAESRPAVRMVDAESSASVSAEIELIDDPFDKGRPKRLAHRITFNVYDRFDQELFIVEVLVTRLTDLVEIEAATVSIPLESDTREAHRVLRGALQEPGYFVNGARVKSGEDSPYSVEVATKSALASGDSPAVPRKASTQDASIPRVPIAIGETYELTFYNESKTEVAIAISIDGLDVFTFSEDRQQDTGRPRFSHFVVAPESSITIPGWHKTVDPERSDNFLRFLVTKYGEGASAIVPPQETKRVGVIHIAVSRSHLPGSNGRSSNSETGFGPPVKRDQQAIERIIDPPEHFIFGSLQPINGEVDCGS